MKNGMKFYLCKHCGNLIDMVVDSKVNPVCCGDPMSLLVANTVDASKEKHVPVVKAECECGDECKCKGCFTVEVGSVPHPMEEAHHIMFIYVETQNGARRKYLAVGGQPKAGFCCCDDDAVAVYAYCNLHGLWKSDIR